MFQITFASLTFLCIINCIFAKSYFTTKLNNGSWFRRTLQDYPTLYFEMDFYIQFHVSSCCPTLYIFTDEGFMSNGNCYNSAFLQIESWLRNAYFHLNPRNPENSHVSCLHDTDLDQIQCTGKGIVDKDYEPKQGYFIIGYHCDEVKEFKDLKVEVDVYTERNTSICEPLNKYNFSGSSVVCSDYYSYTAFPNVFGDYAQTNADRTLDLYNIYFKFAKHCHRDFAVALCMAFFPRCPSFNTNETDFETTFFIPPCRELAMEVLDACLEDMKPFLNILKIAMGYFPYRNKSKCFYEPVDCGKPPNVENGYKIGNQSLTQANSMVTYKCHDGHRNINSINFSKCEFSGLWSELPKCEKSPIKSRTFWNENIIISISLVTAGIIIIIPLSLAFVLKLRARRREHKLQKCRNRKYDAFLSYESGGSDETFVREEIFKRFDQEAGGDFRLLIHPRDFKAGTLILANIQNAVKDSNCSLVLLSNKYVQSRWCQQEFEECVEENKKDSSFVIIVLLMDPLDTMKDDLTCYMKSFVNTRTYLDSTDPRLWFKMQFF